MNRRVVPAPALSPVLQRLRGAWPAAIDRVGPGVGSLLLALALAAQPAASLAQAGQLDPSFGVSGKSSFAFPPNGVLPWTLVDAAVQSDGKVVVAASVQVPGSSTDFGVTRLDADGLLDSAFGTGGQSRIAFDLGGADADRVCCVAVLDDGKILVAGSAQIDTSDLDFAVARLTDAGAPDASFGVDGKITVYFDLGWSLEDRVQGMAIQPDGKIVLVGGAAVAPSSDFEMAVVRLQPNGGLDGTFGTGGKVVVPFDLGGTNHDEAFAVALQRDGKILLAGTVDNANGDSDFAAVRLEATGGLDATFGTGGKVLVAFDVGSSKQDYALGVGIQSDGRIVLAGAAAIGAGADYDFAFTRLNPDGTLDTTFAVGGKGTLPFDVGGDLVDFARDVVIQADDKIIAAGSCELSAMDKDFAVARLLANGTPDESFGDSGGRMVVPFDLGFPGGFNRDEGGSVVLQRDHRILLAGTVEVAPTGSVVGVARLVTDLLHADRFESGDTSAWSATVSPRSLPAR